MEALAQLCRLTGKEMEEAFVDRGYRGHGETQTKVYLSGQKRGVRTHRLRKSIKRRQAIEPVIGHMKLDGLLGRNYLKGTTGDAMNVVLCGAGQNLRIILRELRIFCPQILWPVTSHSTAGPKMTFLAWFRNPIFRV